MIISDAVDGLEAAITAQLADLDGLAVTVTTLSSPWRRACSETSASWLSIGPSEAA